MKNFKKVSKTFVKSPNHTSKIFKRYTVSLLVFILFIIIYNLIDKNFPYIINLLKSLSISLITSIITQYLINLINKENNFKKIFQENNVISIALIIGLFSVNTNILVIILATIVSLFIKRITKSINFSSSLYGILIILGYNLFKNNLVTPLTNLKSLNYIDTFENIVKSSGSIVDYLIGANQFYLSPILCILVFFYLFHKKSIKYNIIIPYILTISLIMLSFGLINDMNIWYLFFHLTSGNLLFLSIYCLVDHTATPTSAEGQIIYGIILGIISSILRFIIPELSIIVALIIGPLFLTKYIDKISFKLKYNQKFYYTYLIILICLVIVTVISSSLII